MSEYLVDIEINEWLASLTPEELKQVQEENEERFHDGYHSLDLLPDFD